MHPALKWVVKMLKNENTFINLSFEALQIYQKAHIDFSFKIDSIKDGRFSFGYCWEIIEINHNVSFDDVGNLFLIAPPNKLYYCQGDQDDNYHRYFNGGVVVSNVVYVDFLSRFT